MNERCFTLGERLCTHISRAAITSDAGCPIKSPEHSSQPVSNW